MYNVAEISEDACVANKGCRLCIMYCPEANCILMNDEKKLPMLSNPAARVVSSAWLFAMQQSIAQFLWSVAEKH